MFFDKSGENIPYLAHGLSQELIETLIPDEKAFENVFSTMQKMALRAPETFIPGLTHVIGSVNINLDSFASELTKIDSIEQIQDEVSDFLFNWLCKGSGIKSTSLVIFLASLEKEHSAVFKSIMFSHFGNLIANNTAAYSNAANLISLFTNLCHGNAVSAVNSPNLFVAISSAECALRLLISSEKITPELNTIYSSLFEKAVRSDQSSNIITWLSERNLYRLFALILLHPKNGCARKSAQEACSRMRENLVHVVEAIFSVLYEMTPDCESITNAVSQTAAGATFPNKLIKATLKAWFIPKNGALESSHLVDGLTSLSFGKVIERVTCSLCKMATDENKTHVFLFALRIASHIACTDIPSLVPRLFGLCKLTNQLTQETAVEHLVAHYEELSCLKMMDRTAVRYLSVLSPNLFLKSLIESINDRLSLLETASRQSVDIMRTAEGQLFNQTVLENFPKFDSSWVCVRPNGSVYAYNPQLTQQGIDFMLNQGCNVTLVPVLEKLKGLLTTGQVQLVQEELKKEAEIRERLQRQCSRGRHLLDLLHCAFSDVATLPKAALEERNESIAVQSGQMLSNMLGSLLICPLLAPYAAPVYLSMTNLFLKTALKEAKTENMHTIFAWWSLRLIRPQRMLLIDQGHPSELESEFGKSCLELLAPKNYSTFKEHNDDFFIRECASVCRQLVCKWTSFALNKHSKMCLEFFSTSVSFFKIDAMSDSVS
ncbi:eIF-2-alpha kinase activator GCN1 [Cichlidogyrus casuarinus]|uniref:EIF-2-alpha kinase activator GCN1 n=1 Tax=Cichlidogyrus casuarinus TaxID=1844966 RepID=A0ABD2QLK1_9PLAT